jgi:hypothetical protein
MSFYRTRFDRKFTDSRFSGPSASFAGPLDAFTADLAGSWSVARRLLTSYTGALLRVRRSSDNTEQDIGFASDGSLDTAALLSFCGANSGFVRTAYDQSGAARNFEQSTAGNQPRIVNAGVVDLGAVFSATQFLDITSGASSQFTNGTQIQVAVKGLAQSGHNGRLFEFGTNQIGSWVPFGGSLFWDAPEATARISAVAPGGYLDALKVTSFERDGSTSRVRIDGSVSITGTVSGTISGTSAFRLGAMLSGLSGWQGYVTDFVIWSTCVNPSERAAAL